MYQVFYSIRSERVLIEQVDYNLLFRWFVGLVIAAAYLTSWAGRRTTALVLVFLCSVFVFRSAGFWVLQLKQPPASPTVSPLLNPLQQMLESIPDTELPIVVSDGVHYLPIAYYSPPQVAKRLYVLIDFQQAVSYTGNDSVDRQLVVLRSYIPLQVQEYSVFASIHRSFLLMAGRGYQWQRWPARLANEGHSVRPLMTGPLFL